MTIAETIYVELLDEAVTAFRPVTAVRRPDGSFELPSSQPPDEQWAFPPGSLVRCELRDLGDGQAVLLAVARADSPDS